MSSQIQITGETKVKSLTGVLVGTTGVVSSLNIDGSLGIPQLDVNGKILVSQLPNSVMEYKGVWNAATNSPTLTNGGAFSQGDVYLCDTAGTVNFGAGPITFVVSDQVIYSGSIWQKASGTNGTVTSVGLSTNAGAITIGSSPITTSGTITANFNGTNLQYVNGAGNLTTFPILTGYVTAVSGTAPVVSSGGTTPAISMAAATGSVDGYLSAVNFAIFNAKQSALTFSSPLVNTSGTISIPAATTSVNGYLASADFTTFNNKQNTITLTTTGSSGVSTLVGATLNIPDYGSALTGYVTLATTQTITGAKTFSAYTTFTSTVDITSGLTFSNSGFTLLLQPPTLSVNRTVTLPNGTGTLALTSDISYPVTSVFGRTGAVVATSGDYTTAQVTESGNLYFTDSRARLALSFVAGSGAYNNTTGVITIPTNNNQITNGAGYTTNVGTVTSVAATGGTGISITGSPITTSGTITITNTAPDQTVAITASTGISVTGTYPNFTITNTSPSSGGTVTSVAALTIGTSGTDLSSSVATSTTTPVITLNVPTASATNRGALSSADWTTFNNKQGTITLTTTGTSGAATFSANTLNIPQYQGVLTNPVTGTGTTNYLPKFTGTSTIGNSNLINDASGNLGLGVTPSAWSNSGNLQLDTYVNISSQGAYGGTINNNAYYNAGWKYIAANYATQYQTTGGEHRFLTAGVGGAAGNAITFTQAMTLNANGGLALGTTTPTTSAGYTTFSTNGSTGGQIEFQTAGAGKAFIYSNSTDLRFYTSGGAFRFENTTGLEVGYGSAIGLYKLDVNGTGRFTGGDSSNCTLKIQASTYPMIDFISNDAASANNRNWRLAGVYNAYGTFEILSSTTQGGVPTTSRFSINGVTGAATFTGNVNVNGILQVKSTSSSPSIWAGGYGGGITILADNATSNRYLDLSIVDSAGAIAAQGIRITNGGNVGIGTSSPSTKLQVEDGYISTYHNINANGAGYGIQFLTNGGGSKNTIAEIAISQVGTARSGDLIFNTSNGGAPATRLTIASTGAATFSSSVQTTDLRYSGSGYLTYGTGTIGTETFIIRNGAASPALTIAYAGAATFSSTVQINDSLQIDNSVLNTPKSILFLANCSSGGNTALGSISWKNTQWDNNIKAQIQATTGADITEGQLLFKTGASGAAAVERMRITSGGNVGIGGTPTTKFELFGSSGNFQIASSGAEVFFTRNDNNDFLANSGSSAGIRFGAQQQLRFATGTSLTTRLTIDSTGAAIFTSSVTATGFFESSDSRLKTLIQDNYQTKGIASITPKLYTKNGKVELGYYAQDFVGILDSAISKGSDDMLSLSYREVLVAKVYALEQRIKELETK